MYWKPLLGFSLSLVFLSGCHSNKKPVQQSVVLLEAKRAEIVVGSDGQQGGELKLCHVNPAVARLFTEPERKVDHLTVVDLIDDWYRQPAKKGKRVSHGGFLFFDTSQKHPLSDIALTLSRPRYDTTDQSLIFKIDIGSEHTLQGRSVIQGVSLYIDR